MGISGKIFDIKPYALHDGPGIRTTLFFKGCPLRCAWCHNPESISFHTHFVIRPGRCIACGTCTQICPQHDPLRVSTPHPTCPLCGSCIEACPADARELAGRLVSEDEIIHTLLQSRPFFETSGGGATFSGGEPLAQPDFLLALLKRCQKESIHTTIDTSGFAPRHTLESVAPFAQLFLFDLKVMDHALHKKYTNAENGLIFSNLIWLVEQKAEIIIRRPVVPGVNDSEQETRHLGEFLLGLKRKLPIQLIPLHTYQKSKHALFGIPQPELPPQERGRAPLEVAAQLEGMGFDVSTP